MIFFDFDGTVVDIWNRYYRVFLTASKLSGFTQASYMEAKRSLVLDERVAHFFGGELPSDYFSTKRAILEDRAFLNLDSLLLPARKLQSFFSHQECRFLTARRQSAAFLWELTQLGLGDLSDQAIIINPDAGISKKAFLEKNFPRSHHIVVGDAQADWETGFLKNIHMVLVGTGLRQPEGFPLTERHMVLPSISVFIEIYLKKGMQL